MTFDLPPKGTPNPNGAHSSKPLGRPAGAFKRRRISLDLLAPILAALLVAAPVFAGTVLRPAGGVPDPLTANGWTPASGTGTVTGNEVATKAVVLSSGFAIAPSLGGASSYGMTQAGAVTAKTFSATLGGGGILYKLVNGGSVGISATTVLFPDDADIRYLVPNGGKHNFFANGVSQVQINTTGVVMQMPLSWLTAGATSPAGTVPFVNYDATNRVTNVPTGKGFSWTVNGAQVAAIASTGSIKAIAGSAFGGVTAVKIAAYVATVDDSLVLADPNGAGASFAITLPAASAAKGQEITVKVVSTHATRVITVIRAGGDTIEGVTAGQTTTTFTTTAALASATFRSDGTSKWYLVATNGTVT